ncbi:hypothetical protein GGE65_004921 [Skermanella aerolata]|uniref:hypothetical protein n=1 Tax=Skermanella aerolata TaxID=393310 RepID=UPI003D1D468B
MLGEYWPYRKLGTTGQLNRQELIAAASRCLEHTMTQQVKSGTSAHRALDCFQVADLAFQSGTPGQRQSGPTRGQVTPQPTDENPANLKRR